jgi:hypothetical protein
MDRFLTSHLCVMARLVSLPSLLNKQGGFIEQLASSACPTCILYLIEEAPNNTWSQLLPSAFYNQNLVLLYGQLQSTSVNDLGNPL